MEPRPRSRRSNLDLSKLSVAPLSRDPTYPSASEDAAGEYSSQHRTYIQDKSAPTTPGVLSRSSSFTRPRPGSSGSTNAAPPNFYARTGTPNSRSYTHLAFANYDEPMLLDDPNAFPSNSVASRAMKGHIPKSKSTTILYPPGGDLGPPSKGLTVVDPASRRAVKHRKTKSTVSIADDGLLYRLGSAIATSNREEKGQSWLTTRASSTSLTAMEHAAAARVVKVDSTEELVPGVDYREFAHTPGSRFSSRRGSRSRTDMAGYTPFGAGARTPRGIWTPGHRTPGARKSADFSGDRTEYFGSSAALRAALNENLNIRGIPGPDFVDPADAAEARATEDDGVMLASSSNRYPYGLSTEPGTFSDDNDSADDEEESREDAEIARLARQSAGFGGFIDRLVGWTFEGREDEDEDEDAHARALAAAARRYEAERRRKARGANEAHAAGLQRSQSEKSAALAAAADAEEAAAAAAAAASAASSAADKADGGWSDVYWLMSVASKALFQQ